MYVLALSLLLALAGQRAPEPNLSVMLPIIMESTEDIVCEPSARLGYDCGPLLVDVESFVTGARAIGASGSSRESVIAAIGVPLQLVSSKEAYKDNSSVSGFPGQFVHEGIHVRLDSIQVRHDTARVVITTSWVGTATRRQPPRTGYNTYEYLFIPQGRCWVFFRARLLAAV